MLRFIRVESRQSWGAQDACNRLLLLLAVMGLLSGCIAKVQIPAVDQFRIASGAQEGVIDAHAQADILLDNLYQLMKANEGTEIAFCTAAKDSRRCIKDGITIFVWGGLIPGAGRRTHYAFRDIVRGENQLEFTKDNSGTTFIGTPMFTKANKCRVYASGGGLQVEMDKYYANWAGIGNMFMAEGWAIDYMDLNQGIVGMQLELDTKGYFTVGGGSRYVLLKFPNIPESLSRSATQFIFLNRKQGCHAGAP
jgi:hypothetical protein